MLLGCWNYTCTLFACWESYVWLSTFATPDLQGYTYEMIGFHIQIMILQTQKTLWISHSLGCWSKKTFKSTNDASNFNPSFGGFVPHRIFTIGQMWDIIFPKQTPGWKQFPPKIFENTISSWHHCSLSFFQLKILVPKKFTGHPLAELVFFLEQEFDILRNGTIFFRFVSFTVEKTLCKSVNFVVTNLPFATSRIWGEKQPEGWKNVTDFYMILHA